MKINTTNDENKQGKHICRKVYLEMITNHNQGKDEEIVVYFPVFLVLYVVQHGTH